MQKILLLLFALALAPVQFAFAAPEDALTQAFDEYAKGQAATERNLRIEKFKQAQYLFLSVVEQGGNGASLFANLGNAALQAEDLGAAVLAFRRALQRDPSHPQAQQNLRHARSLLPSWVPRPSSDSVLDSFFFWQQVMPTAYRAGAAGLCFALAALGIAGAIRWRSVFARNLALLPLLVWFGLCASLIFEQFSDTKNQGVIIQEETIARAADSANAAKRFSEALPAGTEVEVLELRHRWAKINLSNGRSAWVNRLSLALVDY